MDAMRRSPTTCAAPFRVCAARAISAIDAAAGRGIVLCQASRRRGQPVDQLLRFRLEIGPNLILHGFAFRALSLRPALLADEPGKLG